MLRYVERAVIAAVLGLTNVGDVYYVDSTHASASDTNAKCERGYAGRGRTPDLPFATLDYAIGQCTATNGDVIIVAAGHAETHAAAAGAVLDVAGITVWGMGQGPTRPTFTFGTATTTDWDIDAANIAVRNCRFVGAFDDLAAMIDVNQGGFTMEDCEFVTAATFECLNFINLATTKDDFVFRRCKFLQPADPTGTDGAASTGVFYVVDSENILVEDCRFDGYFETAILHNKTTALKYLTWRNNTVNQLLTITGLRIRLVAGTVGCCIGYDTDFVPGLGYKVTKVEDVSTATKDALFTVGGKVLVGLWAGEVTTVLVGAGPTDYVLGIDGGSVMMATSDIHAAAAGYMFQVTGDPADTALTAGTNGGLAAVKASDCDTSCLSSRVLGLGGLATLSLAATRTAASSGAITHTLWYIPLEPGAYVIDAA